MGSKISNTEWWLVIGALAVIDLVQIVLDIFVIGAVANRFIDFVVGISLPFYLKICGVKLDSKKIGGMVAAFFLEQIPGLDALPLWCLDGFTNMLWDKADKKKAELANKSREVIDPKQAERQANIDAGQKAA